MNNLISPLEGSSQQATETEDLLI